MMNTFLTSAGLALRVAEAEDHSFIEEIFRSTREYLYCMGMPKDYVDTLIHRQYHLQIASYARTWPHADTLMIELSSLPIGRMILNKGCDAWYVVDLSLVPEACGKGYGTAVLQCLQVCASRNYVPIKMSVERENRAAQRLSRTLGFEVIEVSDTHERLIWAPPFEQCRSSELIH